MPDRYPFKKDFEPVVNVGEALKLMPIEKFFTPIFIEPIPMIEKNFGSFTAGETRTVELDFLYMPRNELGQFRFVPVDNIVVKTFKQPRYPKWITKNTSGILTQSTDYINALTENLQLTEFFQFEETKAFLDLYAPSNLSTSRIRFYGYRLVLEELKEEPKVYTVVWYESLAPRG
jgi:hypothetical protein